MAADLRMAGHPSTCPGTADEVLCGQCRRKDECERLGHRTVIDDAQRMADGSMSDVVTWCDRCGELLPPKPGQRSLGRLYPTLDVIHMYLSWDRAALPAGQDLADAAAHVLARLSDRAATARRDAFDDPLDRCPDPSEPDPETDKTAALALIDACTQLLAAITVQFSPNSANLGCRGRVCHQLAAQWAEGDAGIRVNDHRGDARRVIYIYAGPAIEHDRV